MARPAAVALTDLLPRAAALRLLACLVAVLALHLPRLPGWADALVAVVMAWRWAAIRRGWRSLPGWPRSLLALGAFGGIYLSFGRIDGQTAGVALLTVMAALKLTELNSRRDLRVLVFLMYFLLITHFLYSQALWTVALMLGCCTLITAVLIDANHPGEALPLRTVLGLGGRTVLQALPLMAVIFVLFPRLPGPLWGLPSDTGAARTGLSDSMSPGDISHLVDSDALAFRIRFSDPPPPPEQRYWRGPVFSRFDGRSWTPGPRPPEAPAPAVQFDGTGIGYQIVLEPDRATWLPALDLPDGRSLPPNTRLDAEQRVVLVKGTVRDPLLYRLRSVPRYRLEPMLPAWQRWLNLQLPRAGNPRTRALARAWREQGLSDAAIVDRALRRFRTDGYTYTLNPPALGRDSVDDFLFDTHRGFCEHYASSFAVLMRAAGIPARVVTGYQGGEKNAVGDYYVVRQSDAHAWDEVWLAGRGWVRADPTAWVAPDRIERGLGAALADTGSLPAFLDPSRRTSFRVDFAAGWDWLNAQWSFWVLGYGPDLQQAFLSRFGIVDGSQMVLALTAGVSVVLGLFGLLWLRRAAPTRDRDPVRRAWRRLQWRLSRAGIPARASEGPLDYLQRAGQARPELAPALDAAGCLYCRLRYEGDADAAGVRALRQAVSAIRPRRARAPGPAAPHRE